MKPHGAILEYTSDRRQHIIQTFRRLAGSSVRQIDYPEICRRIALAPSPRFWVSEERAAIVVSAICRGQPILQSMRRHKREMFAEIHRRYLIARRRDPHTRLSLLVADIVNSPAPRLYMSIYSIRQILSTRICTPKKLNAKRQTL